MNGYDREKAVHYADVWWDDYNPAFPKFTVDCTNYVSQCLLAGGAPMRGEPDREDGWWLSKSNANWSLSWSVAHSLYWYLKSSTSGLKAIQVESPKELELGDVICYDFEGDNRWDHTTLVTGFNSRENPLVNAHTDNSQHRYWSYTDSAAWTANCKYAFFRIEL